jgi:hypothetical protein
MVEEGLTIGSPALVLLALLLLWFYTVWQTFVIEGTLARLAGLQETWLETLALDPAWREYPQVRTVQDVLDSSKRRLARLSLGVLLVAALRPSREPRAASAKIYESLYRLPPRRLREDAVGIMETAARYVVFAALQRSLLVWALAPLFVALFIVWSVHWQLRIVVDGVPQASLHLRRVRLRRKILGPFMTIVMSSVPKRS